MNKAATILSILLLATSCHDSVYEHAVASLSAQESGDSAQGKNKIDRLLREVQDLKNTLAVIKRKQDALEALAEVEANKTLILEECRIYIKDTFGEKKPVLYRDYDADIEFRLQDGSADGYYDGYYVGGCRIYLGKARKTGESWRMVPTYRLKAQRIARLHNVKIKRTADKK